MDEAEGICGLLDGVTWDVGLEDIRLACASDEAASRSACDVVEKLEVGCVRVIMR